MDNKNGKKSFMFMIVGILLIIILAIVLMNVLSKKVPTKAESEFKEYLESGQVVGIIMKDNYSCRVLLNTEESASLDEFKKSADASDFYVVITSRNDMSEMIDTYYENAMEEYQAELKKQEESETTDNTVELVEPTKPFLELNDPNSGVSFSTIVSILSMVLIGGLVVVMVITMLGNGKGNSGALSFGKTKAKAAQNVKVRFSDVAGAEEEKEELKEIVELLKHPKRFTTIGAKIPRGVLLVGPPGTGKTLFAKAVAGEANVPFFSISGSDFVEMFVGVGASRVRDLFNQAKKNMPCIVFIDEIDAVGRQRGAGMGGGNDEREQTLNQLLVQMDGFDTNDGIIIIAATNRVDILDPALLRPGRFDRQVFVNSPDVKGREAIFKVHSRNKPISPDVDFKNLARLTAGFSGADIANLLNEAAILAARHDRNVILMVDILEGINKVIAGPQKKSRIITESDKRITAYHEAGHAIVGYLMKHCDAVQEVSIIPRGMAAGYTISRPKNDNSHITYNKLNDEISMMLGGRASEEIVIQDISTGASNDIKRATDIARKMVCQWGMSPKLPNLFFGGDQEVFIGRDYQTQVSYGDKVASIIDDEIKKIIDSNYARALKLLKDNRQVLDNMVKLLYDKETIYSDEVDMLMEGKSIEEINDYIEKKKEKEKSYDVKKPIIKPVFDKASTIIITEEKIKNANNDDEKTVSSNDDNATIKEDDKTELESKQETDKANNDDDTKDKE